MLKIQGRIDLELASLFINPKTPAHLNRSM